MSEITIRMVLLFLSLWPLSGILGILVFHLNANHWRKKYGIIGITRTELLMALITGPIYLISVLVIMFLEWFGSDPI